MLYTDHLSEMKVKFGKKPNIKRIFVLGYLNVIPPKRKCLDVPPDNPKVGYYAAMQLLKSNKRFNLMGPTHTGQLVLVGAHQGILCVHQDEGQG